MRNGYQIVTSGLSKVLIYSKDPMIGLDDYVEFETEYSEISSYDNFEVSTFPMWAKGQGIYYQGNVNNYRILKKGNSIRRVLFDQHLNKGNSRALQLLFNNGLDSDSDFRYFITHAGFHVTFLVGSLRKFYGRYYYRRQALEYTLITALFLGAVFQFSYSWLRVVLGLIGERFFESRRDRTGFQACMLMLAKPYYINTVAFLIPMGLSFLNLFCEENSSVFIRYAFLTICQLRFYGYCDMVRMRLFSLFSRAASVLYVGAMITSLLPFSVGLNTLSAILLEKMDAFIPFFINGRVSLILFWSIFYLLSEYAVKRDRTYVFVIIGLLLINSHQSVLNACYRVTFLDIGQGDCAVISFPFSSRGLLIDTGGSYYKDVGHDILVPYLRARGFSSVDVIISHEDYDHAGGLNSLVREFRVGNVWFEKQDVITVKGVNFIDPLYRYSYDDINDNSQITYFRLQNMGFLFLGDISIKVEEDLANDFNQLEVDVLKVAHHGSATSSGDVLLSTYRPRWAVISAGRNNRFNHPADEVVKRLTGYGIKVLCTKEDHAVEFMVFRPFTLYRTAAGRYGIIPNKNDIIMLSSVKCFFENNKMINQRIMKKRIS
ncbi:MAG: MBL fold metallo-hydrolase [Erysipelotrichaceae bacterium]|nr:MBL fold metallo-hydrolase [Erysipelotrichaceae bacterium]